MDLRLLDAADIPREEVEEGVDDEEETGGDTNEDTGEETGEEEENVTGHKRKRGKDREWKEHSSFPSKEHYQASEIFAEIKSQMTRNRVQSLPNSRHELFACRHAKKSGWMPCKKVYKVVYPHTSFEIVVYETEDIHVHEEDPKSHTKDYYHWTEAQVAVIRRYLKTKVSRNKLILRELRDEGLVNGSGRLPTLAQANLFAYIWYLTY